MTAYERLNDERAADKERIKELSAKARASGYGMIRHSARRYGVIQRTCTQGSVSGDVQVWFAMWKFVEGFERCDYLTAKDKVIELRQTED